MESNKLKISEIFYSIQGESTRAGMPCVFIRLQGCNCRCSWCDTPYSQDIQGESTEMSTDEIISKIESFNCWYLLFTGGEPLLQKRIIPVMEYFCNKNYIVSVETGGSIDCTGLDSRIIKIIDMKCPDSGMMSKNMYENLIYLSNHDEIKFVIASEKDYEYAKDLIIKYRIDEKVNVILFSPAYNVLKPKDLAEWILNDKLNVRIHLQLHKFIWKQGKKGI